EIKRDSPEAWAVFGWALNGINRWSDSHGGPVFSQDGQNLCVRDRHSKRLLLEVPKDQKRWFCQIVFREMLPQVRRGIPARRIGRNYIDAAVIRHRMAENRRVKSNLRYERNHVATRRKQEDIEKALEDRLRLRARLENCAHWLNDQLTSFRDAGRETRFAGRSTNKFQMGGRLRDSLYVYDYRKYRTLYHWSRGLPVPLKDSDGHKVNADGEAVRLHGLHPVSESDSE